jgi:YD repeat-containing protein
MQATRFNHVSVHVRNLEGSVRLYELPDGSVQMYLRDPAGNLIEIDWPDVTTFDRSLLPELKRLADSVPQTSDALRATLYLEKAEL